LRKLLIRKSLKIMTENEQKEINGLNERQIEETIKKFEDDTKDERKQFTNAHDFNVAILDAKKGSTLGKKCTGLFVGNILLKCAKKEEHIYLIASSKEFIVLVPFGPIQSVVHILAVPNIPVYNAVSIGPEHTHLLDAMQAAVLKVMIDILTPGSKPQELYLQHLETAFDKDLKALESIHVTQKATKKAPVFDSAKMKGQEAVDILRQKLKNFYDAKIKRGIPLEKVVSTDLHLHKDHSAGQIHMHGWIAGSELITENGDRLRFKNTSMDRFRRVMNKYLGVGDKKPKFTVNITNESI